ncbi:FecR family protein [Sphingobacterium sp. GVS05A]|uniref:FecR family protein n=1 Tax=Sphingobacterium sp. GVS05A TaxID=2862679 RepID=UPI001CBD0C54|nr:FecR domain-containing protein [Sphingobacterium sp. GVS05A]
MQTSRFSELFEGYLADKLTPKEMLELEGLIADENNVAQLRQLIGEEFKNEPTAVQQLDTDDNWLHGLEQKVLQTIQKPEPAKIISFHNKWVRLVGTIVLLVGLGLTVRYLVDNDTGAPKQATVLPGGNKATIRLDDGTQVSLSESQSEIVLGKQLAYADGSLVQGIAAENVSGRNMIIDVPKGGTYKIALPDGSKVWLNADSRLRYIVDRADEARNLELEGEAYFEVAHRYRSKGKDKILQPFVVRTPGQTIKVLGTSFNVTAYSGEPDRTTLIEGKVELSLPDGANRQYLKPNQQALIQGRTITIADVESSGFISWKEGTFNFSDESLDIILNQVARWYDIDVDFTDPSLKKLKFEGIVPRYEKLESLLKILEKTSDVRFELKGRLLHVKKK